MATIAGDGSGNTLVGTNSADNILGYGGNDWLTGRAGDDALFGGAGADRLFGGSGSDTITGGLGRDVMSGGAGADVFSFDDKDTGDATYGQADVITDLRAGDIIDLTAVDVLFLDYYDTSPERGGLSLWQAAGNAYITWNTFGTMHDIVVQGYNGSLDDLYNQIRWYDDDNPGTTDTTATIRAGQTRTGTLEVPEDQDWFRVDLVAGKLYDFHVDGKEDGFGTAREPEVALYDANGNYVDDDWGTGRLPYLAETSGTYFLAVNPYGNTNGTYRLGVTSRAYAGDDHGDDIYSATKLGIGHARNGLLATRDDIDAFAITVEDGKSYQIDLASRPGAQHPLDDPYMEMVNEFWDSIAWDDDSGPGNNARITFTAEEDATYFIGVLDSNSGYGGYRISIAEVDSLV